MIIYKTSYRISPLSLQAAVESSGNKGESDELKQLEMGLKCAACKAVASDVAQMYDTLARQHTKSRESGNKKRNERKGFVENYDRLFKEDMDDFLVRGFWGGMGGESFPVLHHTAFDLRRA